GDADVCAQYPQTTGPEFRAALDQQFDEILKNELIFRNDDYQVNVRKPANGLLHLSIRRTDRQPIHDWRELQEIKNQLVGEECEAIELYPAESRLVDQANQFHLWAFTDPTYRVPIGFTGPRSVSDVSIGKSVNRPLGKEPG